MNNEFWNDQPADDDMAFLTFPDQPQPSRPVQQQTPMVPTPQGPPTQDSFFFNDDGGGSGSAPSFSPQMLENNPPVQLDQPKMTQPSIPAQSPFVASAPTPTPPPQQFQQPRQVNPQNNSPNAQNPQQRQLQIQFQQQQNFLRLLEEFMARNNTPLADKYPVIGGKKMNLFLIYAVMMKFGGFNNVLRTKKIIPVAAKFGVPPDNNQLLREFVQMYHRCLLPFEMFANTQDGMKELAARKQQLEQQFQKQAKPQVPSGQSYQTPPTFNNSTPASQPTPQMIEPQSRKISESSSLPQPTPPSVHEAHQATPPAPRPETSTTPDFLRNYVPHQRPIGKVGGYDLKAFSAFGEQIDNLKPVFLFVPELGRIDLNALTLSLTSHIDAEVNVALNVLLIVTSDPNLVIPLSECMGLLDALSILGSDIANALVSGDLKSPSATGKYEDAQPTYDKPNKIDEVFAKYKSKFDKGKDIQVVVDSFTSQQIHEDEEPLVSEHQQDLDTEMNSVFNSESKDQTPAPTQKFELPTYIELLESSKFEAEDLSFKLHRKTFLDRRVMLVEQLSTISLVLRNLSFVGSNQGASNNNLMASHPRLLDYIYGLIYSLGMSSDGFVFARKRVNLMKDILMILSNIAHIVELRSEREAYLILALCLSFGVQLEEEEKAAGLFVPKYDPAKGKFQSHAVDVIAKILCGSVQNRKNMGLVLSGSFSLNPNEKPSKDGELVVKTVGFLISSVPLHLLHEGIEPFNDKLPTCLQLLLSSVLVCETIEQSSFDTNIALRLLISPELIGCNLFKLAFIFAAIFAKTNYENKVMYIHISGKCMELVNILLKSAINYAIANNNKDELNALNSVSKLFPADESILGALMTPSLPPEISVQAVECVKLMVKLQEASAN
ncbi:hypothetical protein OGAPHI_003198 [Ogataea philodendri]|uniref:ARID domain-containing protein n=1 Tax=Ogataea philodendri TaxID=1378263 RepID=A0A9P8P8R1_9ASCO|nr:uncharacterized protein OGAPHI_003198 [Ogataea philodendri]KAH3666749.1 hypothetical protein OGAPHI_003198 [Ogataea philodendri]